MEHWGSKQGIHNKAADVESVSDAVLVTGAPDDEEEKVQGRPLDSNLLLFL